MNCFGNGEECLQEGKWIPVLILHNGGNGRALRLTLADLKICDEHQRKANIGHYLSDEGWTKLVRFSKEAGRGTPVRKLTELVFESDSTDLPF